MKRFSDRVGAVDTSGIRRAFELGARLKDPINLSIGVPAFDAFDSMKRGVEEALRVGKSGYTLTQGIAPLCGKILESRAPVGSDLDVIVTAGVSGAFSLAYMAILDPGDEVLIPDPFFGMYRDLARLVNAVPIFYDTYPSFHLPLEQIEASITSKTRMIVVNSPGNPTGIALTAAELGRVLEIAARHDLWVLYDEIYSLFTYDYPHIDLLGQYDKLIVVNGFSKSHGAPGWRLGYALASRDLIAEMRKIQQYTFVCAPSVLQWGAVEGLDIDLEPTRQDYKRKRDIIVDGLSDHYVFERPTGAFYLFGQAPGGSGEKFFERCVQHNLIIVPGHVFSRRDTHFRLSFSVAESELERGVKVLRAVAEEME